MTAKIAISLPDDVVLSARDAVARGEAPSMSAYVASALEDRRRYEDAAALLADMAAEAGPPSEEDRRWARQALGLD